MLILNSKKFPNILYESREDIYYFPEEIGTSFSFDVTKDLTGDIEAMNRVASFLDDLNKLKEKALIHIRSVLNNKANQYHDTIVCFLEIHKDTSVFKEETIKNMFGIDSIGDFDIEKMIDFLKVKRFGSYIDDELNEQAFIMDLSFNSDYTDELMVVYFNISKDIFAIAHES